MQKHVKNYFKAFGYDQSDIILCEVCGVTATDVHHVEPRSTVSKDKRDEPDNLIALCRSCHDDAHGVNSRAIKEILKKIVEIRDSYKLKFNELRKSKGL